MKKQLFRATTLLLLLSFGVSALLYLFMDVAQLEFKMDAKRDISAKGHLQTVKLSLKEFNKNQEKDEVWINGKLYDVSSYVIINDTAIISVFHDEQEEGLVKSIVDSFEPNDKYSTDNVVHVCKHRIHAPDDGKVLVERYALSFGEIQGSYLLLPYVAGHTSQLSTSVIKPPPRLS